MALRPLRNAMITFGLVNIPVRFYTATKSEDIHFNLLHESCGTRVNRKWWCQQHEAMIEPGEMVRAFAISKNQYVTFSPEELEALESDENKALDITEFVELDQIDPVFFEKAYFLGPAAGGSKTYRLLAAAMKKQNKVALARWVSGSREHLVVLRPFEDGLVLHTMFYADEVRDFSAVEKDDTEVKEKELKLAEMLIDELTEKSFDPLRYKDEYRERLMDRIAEKSKGKTIISEHRDEDRPAEVVDIMEALRRSLEGGRAPAKRAPARAASKEKTARAAGGRKKKAVGS